MGILLTAINNSVPILNEVNVELTRLRSTSKVLLDDNIWKHFCQLNEYIKELEMLPELFKIRECYFENLKSVFIPDNTPLYPSSVSLKHRRMMYMQGYCATSWAIYDTITECIGKFILTDNITAAQCFPRLSEHILQTRQEENKSKDCLGFRMSRIFKISYGYPIMLFYNLRNVYVHDNPFSVKNIFAHDAPISEDECFELTDDATQKIKSRLQTAQIIPSYSRVDEMQWSRKDIRELLKLCENEVDDGVAILLNWGVESVKSQVLHVFQRDR